MEHPVRQPSEENVSLNCYNFITRNSSGDEIPERDIGSYTLLVFNASDGGVPLVLSP